MAGISSKALKPNYSENKYKFTGQLLDDDLELNWYQFRFRTMDPQIGRFLQIDPLSDRYVYNSTYAYAENDVVNSIDLEGLERGPVRYMDRTTYAENRRSYREINSYVPSARSHRTTGTYIPNQSAGSAPTPANIYEPARPGTGEQFTGPFITRGNDLGKFAVQGTKMVNELKKYIEKVTVTTDNMLANNAYNSGSGIKIEWGNKEAEKQFNQLQGAYDSKVQEIRDNNKLPAPPGAGASDQDWKDWLSKTQEAIQTTKVQIALLGPSPTQQITSDTQNSKDFKLVKKEVHTLPDIRPAN